MDEEQKQRYDRQIRVWGAEAQSRIQTSRVLIVGLRGINVEVTKNVVLAGVNVVIQDSETVHARDLSSNFFLTSADVGATTVAAALPRIQQLNTYASVTAETRPLHQLDDDYFRGFSVVVVHDCAEVRDVLHATPYPFFILADDSCPSFFILTLCLSLSLFGLQEQALRLNALCRLNTPHSVFFLSGTFGLEGWFIADFGDNFQYTNDPPNNKVVKKVAFPSLQTVFDQKWLDMKSKHFAVSTTYVKSRILRIFVDKYRRYPAVSSSAGGGVDDDGGLLAALAAEVLAANGLADDAAFAASLALADLPRVATAETVMVCSALGSFLAQEVIKAVSLSGEPGFNVFVCSGFDCSVIAMPIAPPPAT